MELGHIRVIGRGGLLLRQPDIPGGDVPAVGPVIGYAAVGCQVPVAGNGQGLAPEHQGPGGVPVPVRQVLGPADIHRLQRHHGVDITGEVGPVQPAEAAVLPGHPNLVRVVITGLLHHIGHLTAPDQLLQNGALLIVQGGRFRRRGDIARRRLQGLCLLPGEVPHQGGNGGQAHQGQDHAGPLGAALLPAAPGPGGIFRLGFRGPIGGPFAGLLLIHGHRGNTSLFGFSPIIPYFSPDGYPFVSVPACPAEKSGQNPAKAGQTAGDADGNVNFFPSPCNFEKIGYDIGERICPARREKKRRYCYDKN